MGGLYHVNSKIHQWPRNNNLYRRPLLQPLRDEKLLWEVPCIYKIKALNLHYKIIKGEPPKNL